MAPKTAPETPAIVPVSAAALVSFTMKNYKYIQPIKCAGLSSLID
jgi:hypothetical protein